MDTITPRGGHPIRRRNRSQRVGACREPRVLDKDAGFTLIELVIVVTIIPLVVGAIAMGLVSVFSLQSSVTTRLGDTADSQTISAHYINDVQSAASITAQPTPQCGSGIAGATQVLGLEWNLQPGVGGYLIVVSYVEVSNSATTYSLVREYCALGPSATPTSSTVIAYDVPNPVPQVSIVCANTCPNVATDQVPATNVRSVSLPVTAPQSNYSYTLVAAPKASGTVVVNGGPLAPQTSAGCGFAAPGSGTYASTLCFVDFAALNNANNLLAATQGCLEMTVSLPGNYQLYFCIHISGPIAAPPSLGIAAGLPTWTNGFLGNSIGGVPFYTNVPGSPAIYQNVQGATNTITITNITVVNAQGVPATGWEFVSADAESTDNTEWITWSTPTGQPVLHIIPNGGPGSSNIVGNACATSQGGGYGLTGDGTNSVTCATTIQEGTKTGTAMLWSAAPKSMTVTMHGQGLEAVAFGLMLS